MKNRFNLEGILDNDVANLMFHHNNHDNGLSPDTAHEAVFRLSCVDSRQNCESLCMGIGPPQFK